MSIELKITKKNVSSEFSLCGVPLQKLSTEAQTDVNICMTELANDLMDRVNLGSRCIQIDGLSLDISKYRIKKTIQDMYPEYQVVNIHDYQRFHDLADFSSTVVVEFLNKYQASQAMKNLAYGLTSIRGFEKIVLSRPKSIIRPKKMIGDRGRDYSQSRSRSRSRSPKRNKARSPSRSRSPVRNRLIEKDFPTEEEMRQAFGMKPKQDEYGREIPADVESLSDNE